MPNEFTVEDQLVSDLTEYWTAHPPAGLADGTPIVHFRTTDDLPIPAVIIGHEGFEREKAKGMEGTGRVNLRIAIRTDLDVTDPEDHRLMAAACDAAILAMPMPGPLALTYLHAFLREAPGAVIEDRRQITALRYQAIATRCEPV